MILKVFHQKVMYYKKDVQGMIELNGKIVKLKSSDKIDCFYIGDTSNYSEYEKGGIIQEWKYTSMNCLLIQLLL